VTPLGNSIPTAANGSLAAIAPDASATLRTIRALRDENFDVVNLHEPFAPGPTLTALVLGGRPLVGTFHRSGESNWIKSLQPLVRWSVKHLTIRAAVSAEARATAMSQLGGSYELVWNGIDPDEYRNAPPWPTSGPTIMFLGRHEPRKGLAVLIEAMQMLGRDVRLWVASQGPETERLKASTVGDERIEWLGPIGEQEKIGRIRGCDVLCAPSLHGESFGVVLLEGLASGTPVVASDLRGYRNVVTPGVNARLAPPGDSEALAKELQAALEKGPETAEMVACGLKRAADFSMDSLAARYIDIYEQATEEYARTRSSP